MTMNSPDALAQLFHLAISTPEGKAKSVETAELMREIGLKCIGFNGVGSLRYSLALDCKYQFSLPRSHVQSIA
jgi:hypothetical protein